MRINIQSPLYVVGYTAVVTLVFTAAVMILQVATAEQVRENQQTFRRRALVQLFAVGLGVTSPEALSGAELSRLVAEHVLSTALADPETNAKITVYAAARGPLPTDGTLPREGLLGYAVPYAGVGFWAPIDGLLALAPDLSRSTAIAVLTQSETPGLGGRITEEEFRRQFADLKVSLPKAGDKYLYIGGGKPSGPGDPRFERSVQAITGATQTCLALDKLMNASLERFHRAAATAGWIDGPSPPAGMKWQKAE